MQYLLVKRIGNKVVANVYQEMTDALHDADATHIRKKTLQVIPNPDAYQKKAVLSGAPETVLEMHGKGWVHRKDIFILRFPQSIRKSVFFALQDDLLRFRRVGKPLPTTKPARFPVSFDLRQTGEDKTIKIFAR